MAIPQSEIFRYEGQASMKKSAEVIREAKAARKQIAFLSHSHKDARLAKSVQGFLHAHGWEVYIDWDDTTMPESPNRETASQIQRQIRDLTWFLFLATHNLAESHWCPWEIGYADGIKPYENILVIPTSDSSGSYGSEYMQLYRRLDPNQSGGYGVFRPDNTGIMVSGLQFSV